MKESVKYILYFVLSVMIIYAFSFVPFNEKKIKYYNAGDTETILYDGIKIKQFFELGTKDVERFNFVINSNVDYYKDVYLDIEDINNMHKSNIPNLTFDKNKRYVNITISNGDIRYSKQVYLNEIKKGDNYITIRTPKFKNINSESIELNISTNNISIGNKLKIMSNSKTLYSTESMINGRTVKSEVSTYIGVRQLILTPIIIVGIILLLIFLKKSKDYYFILDDNTRFKYICVYNIFLSIVLAISYLKINIAYGSYNIISHNYLVLLTGTIFLLAKLLLFSIKKYRNSLEKLYLIFVTVFGIMFAFTLFPNGVNDENHHYYQAEKLATFNFIDSNYYPISENFSKCDCDEKECSTYACLDQVFFKVGYDDTQKYVINTANNYNYFLYIPSALGIFIGRTLNLSVAVGYYLARLFNLLFAAICGYFAIKMLDKGKLILFIFLLNPILVQQSVAISADLLTNYLSILFISFVLSNKKYSVKNKIWLALLCLALLFVKKPYFIIILLLLSRLPGNLNLKKYKKWIIIGLSIIIGYLVLTNFKYTYYTQYSLSTIIRNPMDFINLLIDSFKVKGAYYFETMFGIRLGWLKIEMNNMLIYVYAIILFASTLVDKVQFNKKQILTLIITSFIIVIAIFVGFLSIYTSRSVNFIFGIQGRYFLIPLLCILLSCSSLLQKVKINITYDKYIKLASLFLIILYISSIYRIAAYYM